MNTRMEQSSLLDTVWEVPSRKLHRCGSPKRLAFLVKQLSMELTVPDVYPNGKNYQK